MPARYRMPVRLHVFAAKLRAPDVEPVRRYASRQRSTLLARTHPQWQLHVVGNVRGLGESTGSVVLARWHHSIADRLDEIDRRLLPDETWHAACMPLPQRPRPVPTTPEECH